MRLIEKHLLELFAGLGAMDAPRLAKQAADAFDMDQRNKKVYELRATCDEFTVACVTGVSPRRVRQIVKAVVTKV